MEGGGGASTKPNMVPLHEYLLQGSILESHRDALLHRLNGLCDSVDTGPEKFQDLETVFHLKGAPAHPLVVRARRALDHPEAPLHLRYMGMSDAGIGDKTRHTLVRNCIDVGTSDNLLQFLQEMGFRLDHEYISKGYVFRKGRMKIIVSKIFRISHGKGGENEEEALSHSYLVELTVLAPHGQDQIQEDMRNFAEQLKPLVHLEKIDHRRL